MKKMLSLLLCYCVCCGVGQAQTPYSYVSDRKFLDPTDLLGYNFRPSKKEILNEGEMELSAGSYSFGVTQNNLYVEGADIKGVYSINNINPTEFGYQLLLMNARDPRVQGHLKIILTPAKQVEALVFRRNKGEKEMIFHLPEMPDELAARESEYFTDRNELVLANTDSLWGKRIVPFLRIHPQETIQERLQPADSTGISFKEVITIIDKTKKKDKKKNEDASVASSSDSTQTATAVADTTATVPTDTTAAAVAAVTPNKNIKIIKDHYVTIRSILKYDDGTNEDKSWEFKIKNIDWKEDAKSTDDRYQVTLTTTKGEEILLYLSAQKKVSYVEALGKVYLMRGY